MYNKIVNMQEYKLPDLPYLYNALEPVISKEIMELHHQKHHAGYVKNLNEALSKYPEFFEKTPEDLLASLNDIPKDINTAVRNNGGGYYNHSLFWETMKPFELAENRPEGDLLNALESQFGSFEDFKNKFNDVGVTRFGSGWVWLVRTQEGKLDVLSTANQDNPISDGHFPIMGNDVWEHAYYLQYKNLRADYLKAWWNVVDWQKVGKRFLNTK